MTADRTIAVIGAGAWGTALANAAARAGRRVLLCARDAASARSVMERRESPRLPGIRLADAVTVSGDPTEAAGADAVLLVLPAQNLRPALAAIAPHLPEGLPAIVCAKGIERGAGKFMTEVVAEVAPHLVPAILSGPSFASDVARGLPTAVTLATADEARAAELVRLLGSPTFRPYHSTDIRGVEIGGAAKNVLAIAAGIVVGRALGASAQAALTTRGFAELMRFGRAFGARSETIAGLSGLGDLLLSCSSTQSRNFSFGIALGRDETPDAHLLSEGRYTAPVLAALARDAGIEMPVASAVADVIAGTLTIDGAIEALLTRPFRSEA